MIKPRAASSSKVLSGQRILVTRAADQARQLSDALAAHGAEPVPMPLIEIEPLPATGELCGVISRLQEFDWLIFTSTNSVRAFLNLMANCGQSGATLELAKVVAVGSSTEDALREHGVVPALVPDEFHGDAVLQALIAAGVADARILLPRAEVARESLPDGLRDAGANVDVLPIYRTVKTKPDPVVVSMLRRGEIDIVTLTSSSTVQALIQALGGDPATLARVRLASIGPQTARTVSDYGLAPWVVAAEHTISGLVDAIVQAQEAQ